MRIASVTTVDWMCFAGAQEVQLPAGPIALVARYVGNARRSNWAGKTAFLEAVGYALTGRHRKRVEDGLITRGADGLSVKVVLEVGAARVVVARTRPRGGPTVLELALGNGTTLQREAAETHLAGLLQMGVDDWKATTWFEQDDTLAIVAKTSGQRQEVVNRWLDLLVWQRLSKRVGVRVVEAQREHELAVEADRVALDAPCRDDSVISQEHAAAESRVRELTALVEQLTTAAQGGDAYATAQSRVSALEEELRSAAEEAQRIRTAPARAPDPAQHDEARTAARLNASALDDARREVVAAEKLGGGARFDGKCPVTLGDCPASDHVREQRGAIELRLKTARDAVRTLSPQELDARTQLSTLDRAAAAAKTYETRLADAVARVRGINERLKAARTAVPEEVAGVDDARRDLAKARQDLDQAKRVVWERRSELETAGAARARAAAATSRRTVAELALRRARLAAQAVGPSGIVAKLAASQLDDLEGRVNALLAPAGLSVRIAWQRELQDPSPVCYSCGGTFPRTGRNKECPTCATPRGRKRADELELLVSDGSGEEEDVSAKSGAAKVLVASAVRLVAGAMLRERRGCPVQWAFVDEPFGSLDAENREQLARTFVSLLGRVGLEQALVVSHDAALLAALPSRLVVERDGSVSRYHVEV